MEFKTKEKALEAVYNALPYPDQISDIDMIESENGIFFKWRNDYFYMPLNGRVEQWATSRYSARPMIDSSLAVLMQELIAAKTPISSPISE